MLGIAVKETVSERKRGKIKGRSVFNQMKDAVRKAEHGSPTGGTGATVIKLRSNPLGRLIESRKIGSVERMAADDIATAFFALTNRLMVKSASLERGDPSHGSREPVRVTDAISRYQSWATHWSMLAKRGDRTLEIVIAAIVDERAFSVIEADLGIRHGMASKATVRGLRDYAARADGWVSRQQGAQWKADARNTFEVHMRGYALAVARAKRGTPAIDSRGE